MRLYIDEPYSTSPTNHIIRGKVYHKVYKGDEGLLFTLNANFDNAFTKNTLNYIYINGGEQTKYYTEEYSGNQKDIDIIFKFNSDEETYLADFNFHDGTKKQNPISIIVEGDNTRKIFLPNKYTNLKNDETIGFAFGYNGDDLKDISRKHCYPFGNPVTRNKQFGYARLYPDDSCYGASHNINEFGFTFDNIPTNYITYKVPGIIGYPSVGGYEVKIAKNKNDDKGIYIISTAHKPWEYTKFYCRYNYNRHFFIDTNATEYYHDDIIGYNMVYNFLSEGNYWLSRFICERKDSATPEDKKSTYDELINEGVKYYSKGSEYTLFIPYTYLNKLNPQFTKDSNIGFMFNINQGGGDPYGWKNWVLPKINPTGYSVTMLYEDRKSYIHLDSSLNLIEFKEIKETKNKE